jgi:hypothetical protein
VYCEGPMMSFTIKRLKFQIPNSIRVRDGSLVSILKVLMMVYNTQNYWVLGL